LVLTLGTGFYVVEGIVSPSSDHIRVTAQLHHTRMGAQALVGDYDRDAQRSAQVQRDIRDEAWFAPCS